MPRQSKSKSTKSSKPVKPQIDSLSESASKNLDTAPSAKLSSRSPLTKIILFALLLFIMIAGLVWFRYKHLIVVATVNGQPISSVAYVKQLHQLAGRQILEQMVIEKLILQQAESQGIQVTTEEYDQKVAEIEQQFAAMGGLAAFLDAQNISDSEFRKQVELNLITEKLAGDSQVTDQEVSDYYQENQEFYQEVEEAEALDQIRQMLEGDVASTQVQKLIGEYQKTADIKFHIPGFNLQSF